MTTARSQIVPMLRDGPMTTTEIAARLRVSERRTLFLLDAMNDVGIVTRTERPRERRFAAGAAPFVWSLPA
jgi:predicted transcriptional regulator